jgi:parvulin-like peptidyl-prolyl isomerase
MNQILQVGDQIITQEQIFSLLTEHQMLLSLAREIILDQAIADIECSVEETQTARQQFFAQTQITSDEQLQQWLQANYLTKDQLENRIVRNIKLEKFKRQTWENQLETYYLKRKRQLDRVVYSLIRTKDPGVAQALYFRLQSGEQSFTEAAKKFSQGQEAETGGLIGPVELNVPHPTIANILTTSQPGKIVPPTRIGEWIVILRLEKYLAAQLDQSMRSRLLEELFNNWLREQIQKQVSFKSQEVTLE